MKIWIKAPLKILWLATAFLAANLYAEEPNFYLNYQYIHKNQSHLSLASFPKNSKTKHSVRKSNKNFWIWNSILMTAVVYDVETTFKAKSRNPNIIEGNPIAKPFVDSGRPATYAFAIGTNSIVVYASFWLKQKGKKWWYVFPLVFTVSHIAAGTSNLIFIK